MSDLDADFVKIQVGGRGRPNTTALPVLTPTRLCTSIKATHQDGSLISKVQIHCAHQTVPSVKTGSPQVLLGGPGGQGTRVEVSPDTSRAWATTEVNPRAYGQSLEHGKVVQSLRSISRARTNPWRLGIVQGVLASSPGTDMAFAPCASSGLARSRRRSR